MIKKIKNEKIKEENNEKMKQKVNEEVVVANEKKKK